MRGSAPKVHSGRTGPGVEQSIGVLDDIPNLEVGVSSIAIPRLNAGDIDQALGRKIPVESSDSPCPVYELRVGIVQVMLAGSGTPKAFVPVGSHGSCREAGGAVVIRVHRRADIHFGSASGASQLGGGEQILRLPEQVRLVALYLARKIGAGGSLIVNSAEAVVHDGCVAGGVVIGSDAKVPVCE